MLMLTVKPGQYVQIGDNIRVCVQRGKKIRAGDVVRFAGEGYVMTAGEE